MKPILLGMTNPHSADPAMALAVHPVGATGWRTWKMVAEATGGRVAQEDYMEMFDRRNLLVGPWRVRDAREAGRKFMEELSAGQVAIVLGADVWKALGVVGGRPTPGVSRLVYGGGGPGIGRCVLPHPSVLHYLPHPSGRCRWYNDKLNRWSAGRLLADQAEVGRKPRCAA